MYRHKFIKGGPIDLTPGKAVCVGRNYLDHIHELNNPVPGQPLLFIKSNNSFADMAQPLIIPAEGECHNELEVALLIGKKLDKSYDNPIDAVVGVGLALDLTLRDVQDQLKSSGHPWERAKSFDNSCPISGFVPAAEISSLDELNFDLQVNGVERQHGLTKMMMYSCRDLLSHIAQTFTLMPGDIVLTGTPKGVGKIVPGDKLTATLNDYFSVTTEVAA